MGTSHLAGSKTPVEELAFRCVARKRDGRRKVRVGRLRSAAPEFKLTQRCKVEGIRRQPRPICDGRDLFETLLWAKLLCDSDRSVERNNRRRSHREQSVVKGDNGGPVCSCIAGRRSVDRCNRSLDVVFGQLVAGRRRLKQANSLADATRYPIACGPAQPVASNGRQHPPAPADALH